MVKLKKFAFTMQLPAPKNGMADSVRPVQTALFRSSQIWIRSVCSDLTVSILKIFMLVIIYSQNQYSNYLKYLNTLSRCKFYYGELVQFQW